MGLIVPLVIALTSLTGIGTANAEAYREGAFAANRFEVTEGGDAVGSSPLALRVVLGDEAHPNFAVEGLLASGPGDADVEYNGVDVPGTSLNLDNVVGRYLKPKFKPSNELELFARLGLARVKGTVEVRGFGSESDSDNDFSRGLGASYAITPKHHGTVDYTSYLNRDGVKVSGFSFGVGFRF